MKRYYVELTAALILYVSAIYVSRRLWSRFEHSSGRLAIALIPVFPVILMFASMVRFVRRTDEFQRKIAVESLALAGGVTATISVTYGLMEGSDGFPRPSAWWTYTVFMLSWIVCDRIVRRRLR